MSPPRIVGIVFLILGVILLVIGLNASHSVADQVSNTFTGRFTQSTTWYILGGIALSIFGAILAFRGPGKGITR